MLSILKKNKNKTVILKAFVSGTVIPIEEVEDKIFASGASGEGIGIRPTQDVIIAPADGVIRKTVSTAHAVMMELENGMSIVIHAGVNTVRMNGDGFETFVKPQESVREGQTLIRFDLDKIRKEGLPTTIIMVVLDSHLYPEKEFEFYSHMEAVAGETVIAKV